MLVGMAAGPDEISTELLKLCERIRVIACQSVRRIGPMPTHVGIQTNRL